MICISMSTRYRRGVTRHAGGKVSVEVFKEDKQSLGGLAAQIHLARRLGDVQDMNHEKLGRMVRQAK
jgi:hypothetical protein